ncbi:MAG: hypothetical protein AAGB14_10375, partial [Verrucomicrobiota bacterium]
MKSPRDWKAAWKSGLCCLLLAVSCRETEVPQGETWKQDTAESSALKLDAPASYSPGALRTSMQRVRALPAIDPSTHDFERSLELHRVFSEELLIRVELLALAPAEERRALESRMADLLDPLLQLRRLDEREAIRHREGS